ncbi:MAG: hypothetical protein R6W74_06890, partial [Nitrosomonas halophila]
RELLTAHTDNSWFGELVTETDAEPPGGSELRQMRSALQKADCHARLAAGARVAWQAMDQSIRVFANGNSHLFGLQVREPLVTLCADGVLPLPADNGCAELLEFLMREGALEVSGPITN